MGLKAPIASIARMLLQLLCVGYALLWLFDYDSGALVAGVLVAMMMIASWLALNVVETVSLRLYTSAFIAIIFGGGTILFFITQVILEVEPWYQPQYLVPLGGMLFSSCMTAISLALERFGSEVVHQAPQEAKKIAINAALIPVINSMLAVGVVSLPGMMTGQILSGVEPYIAARYQILIMTMIFSSTGLTVFIFMHFQYKNYIRTPKNRS